MKILVANIGSTSLKWRLFDFANNGERLLLQRGGFEARTPIITRRLKTALLS